MRRHASQPDILASAARVLLPHEQEVQREADIERIGFIDLLNVFTGQLKRQSGDVAVKVRLLATSDYREDVGSLVENISQATAGLGQSCESHAGR